jgi:hypothetical protein
MTWLTSLPATVLVISGLVLALLVVVGARLAVRALVPAAERDAAYTIAAPLMPALGAIFALLMGLTLASEVGFLASAQGIVSGEAADASRLAWAATSPGVDSEPIQAALLGYLQAVRAHEWNGGNAANGDDPATAHAIASLENAVRTQAARPTLGTPASTELLASLDALTSDRRARLAAASRQLPALFVAILLLTGGGVDRERRRPDTAQRPAGGPSHRRPRGRDRTQPGLAVCPGHPVARPDHRKRPAHRCRRARPEHRLLPPLTPTDARISAARERKLAILSGRGSQVGSHYRPT